MENLFSEGNVLMANINDRYAGNSNFGFSPARRGVVGVYWIPIHSSNFHDSRIPDDRPFKVFGLHSTHADPDIFDAVEEHLEKYNAANTNNSTEDDSVFFRHIDPNWQFYQTGGHIVNPQQTQILYQTFEMFD